MVGNVRCCFCLFQSPGESSSTVALGVEVILRQIFSYLPTGVLLFACSLVNKIWNTEARTFVRDYRRCRLTRTKAWRQCVDNLPPVERLKLYSILETLKEYEKVCRNIIESGRVVPFNYLVLPEYSCMDQFNTCRSDKIVLKNLTGGMKIKYLEFLGSVKVNCACGRVIARLLTETCCDVQTLIICAGFRTFENLKNCGWVPDFVKLEEIDISWVGTCSRPMERDKNIFGWLVQNAPLMKSVRVKDLVASVGILPNDIFSRVKLKGSLDIDIRTPADLKLLHSACSIQSELRELRIFRGRTERYIDDEFVIDGFVLLEFQKCLEEMLQKSSKTLASLGIFDGFSLGSVPYPVMAKLTHLRVEAMSWFANPFWKSIFGIDFGIKMPVLVKVDLALNKNYDLEFGNVVNPALTVRSLRIHLGWRVTEIWPLTVMFPNISELECSGMRKVYFVKHIFKYWCNLSELFLSFDYFPGRKKNYDIELCGIHWREAQILREQDSDYLANVQIVPIRPCLVTMLSK